ncbi:acyl carrier protein [Streptomyces anulatus]|uniref:acyl carrier protein n=1 Tax=Streptomyces anulatus TaxID=1892 RepID=UPI001C5EC91B|nr:acyl carrier protein [Streptomyces anulatus]
MSVYCSRSPATLIRKNAVCFRELIPVVPDPLATPAGLWTGLLGHTDLRDDSDFFELGGDSLLITFLARRLDQRLGVQAPARAMPAARTPGRQSRVVLGLLAHHEPSSIGRELVWEF